MGRGEEFVSTYPYPESPYGRTYADVIKKSLGWIVYQIFLPMVLRCEGSAMIVRVSQSVVLE